ncbi:MAG: methyltransferase domain-containing protein [Candidatus Iainarchaeum archaeon]|uniref:Methyltransferase domain-containing protein n=1 Tax=Candidatus Iainarchaeum sp. TaxID=3101447 RepID=A0A7T9DJW7_9ARCH|nr:MAG: methyltransferase domain-containing protein [Candidatus Diapherotrites archaeon]
MPSFKQQMQQKLHAALSPAEQEKLPAGFQRLGHIVILRLHPSLESKKQLIGEAALTCVPGAKTACNYAGKISSEYREPVIEWIAGEHNTVVNHFEHDCVFRFDVTKLMWSQGNMNERKRMYLNVKKGEVVVDFFCGLGYWSIPIAKHASPAHVYAIDANENAINAIQENRTLNKIPKSVLTIIHGKCEEVAPTLGKIADRVIMGYLPAPRFALPSAMHVLKDQGGIIHYEGMCPQGEYETLVQEVRDVATQYGKQVELVHAQEVKSMAPRKYHYTLDLKVTPIA